MTNGPDLQAVQLPNEQELRRLMALADAGDEEGLAGLRQLLDSHPEIYEQIGDLAAHAERVLIAVIAGPNQLLRESLVRKLGDMRTELAGPATNLLERMAVERVLACWLQLQHADTVAANPESNGLPTLNFRLKRQENANRRYLGAVKSLMDLRRLLPNGVAPSQQGASLKVFASCVELDRVVAVQGT